MSILTIKNLSAGYSETYIVSNIDMVVHENEIVTIAGTNGAGKSTVLKAVMGLLPRVEGSAVFLGTELLRQPTEDRIRSGITYVPQVANVFGSMTVYENLQLTGEICGRPQGVREMFELFPVLAERRGTYAESLSGGERQQLAFARALLPRPKLILLDEPSAALSPALTGQVFEEVKRLKTMGVAVLMVEQRARQALAFSDRGYILDAGKIVLSGTGADLLGNEEMAELYLGHHPQPQTADA